MTGLAYLARTRPVFCALLVMGSGQPYSVSHSFKLRPLQILKAQVLLYVQCRGDLGSALRFAWEKGA